MLKLTEDKILRSSNQKYYKIIAQVPTLLMVLKYFQILSVVFYIVFSSWVFLNKNFCYQIELLVEIYNTNRYVLILHNSVKILLNIPNSTNKLSRPRVLQQVFFSFLVMYELLKIQFIYSSIKSIFFVRHDNNQFRYSYLPTM